MARISTSLRIVALLVPSLVVFLFSIPSLSAGAPQVKSFAIPSSHIVLTVPIIRFTASEDVAVAGYMTTESATPPSANAAGWTATPPIQYTFKAAGRKTLYAWVKDAGGIVSASVSANTVVGPDQTMVKTSMAAGMSHVVALKSDGKVTAWGDNYEGQSTTPMGLSGVVAVAAGAYHTVALKSDGAVTAWGDNQFGQATIPAGLTNVVAIAAGVFHTVALKSDGTVVAWGRNNHGQITVPVGLTKVVAIAANHGYTVALKSDGTVTIWGRQLSYRGDTLLSDHRDDDDNHKPINRELKSRVGMR